jgi:hypothetical protein
MPRRARVKTAAGEPLLSGKGQGQNQKENHRMSADAKAKGRTQEREIYAIGVREWDLRLDYKVATQPAWASSLLHRFSRV